MFSCEYCETSKNTYFKEHLRTATSDFRKWLFKTFFLDSHFQNHLDLAILQKYQSLLNESFKYKSVHSPPLNLTPTLSFESSFCIFIINGHDTKSTCLLSLGSLSFNRSFTMENKTFLSFLNFHMFFLLDVMIVNPWYLLRFSIKLFPMRNFLFFTRATCLMKNFRRDSHLVPISCDSLLRCLSPSVFVGPAIAKSPVFSMEVTMVIALGRFLNGCVVFLIESEDHWNIIWTNTVNILI